MRRHYRRFVLQLYRRLRHPRSLKQSRVKRWLARHFTDKSLWKPTRRSFAGGLAIGMFITMIIAPGQMPVAVALAALFRVNIPVAVVACWLSNPVTVPAMVWWEIELGNWIIDAMNFGTPPSLGWKELNVIRKNSEDIWDLFNTLKPWALSLYVGGVVAGAVASALSYVLTYALWDLTLMFAHRRRDLKAKPKPTS